MKQSGDNEQNSQPKKTRRQFVFSLLAVIALTFANVSIPIFTVAVVIIWPLPVVYLAIQQGQRRAGIMIVMAAAINGFLFNPLMSLVTVVGFGFIGFVMAGALQENFPSRRVLLLTVGAAVISNIILAGILILSYEQGLQEGFAEMIREYAIPLFEGEEMSPMIEMQLQFIMQLMPAILIVSGVVTGILNYYFVHWFLSLKNISVSIFKSIAYWRFPAGIVSLLVVVGLLLRENQIMLNLTALAFFVIFMQGFGVGLYYVGKRTQSFIFRWFYVLAVIIIPIFPIILLAVGLLDLWLDLRKLSYS